MAKPVDVDLEIDANVLFSQYDWFYNAFNNPVQASSDDFLYEGLRIKLFCVSKDLNNLSQNEAFFVTKVKIDPKNEIYIRCSGNAINTILTRALGPAKKFDINKLTDLEAQLISAFNDNLYNFLNDCHIFIPNIETTRKFDMTYLTFLVSDEESKLCGKIILTFASELVAPRNITSSEEKFSMDSFLDSTLDVGIKVGTTSFSVGDLKSLEVEDIVVLDNSNIQVLTIVYEDYIREFRVTPNPGLIISVDSDGGEDMAAPAGNIWDSIQVEMSAEFDKVKISLGELKNIENGLVVDVGSIYTNNVTLRVEEKLIASGELVIVNDRYGVKINKIYADSKQGPMGMPQQPMPGQDFSNQAYNPEQMPQQYGEQIGEPMGEQIGESMGEDAGGEGDFDYSDFDLDDEDL